jgi:hypothetical protein
MAMSELSIRVLAADGRTNPTATATAWDEILSFKNNTDLIVISAFSAIGLAVALVSTLAFPLSDELAMLAYLS